MEHENVVTVLTSGGRTQILTDDHFFRKMRFWCLYLSQRGLKSRAEAEVLFGWMLRDVLGVFAEEFLPCRTTEDFGLLCRAVTTLLSALDRQVTEKIAEILLGEECFDGWRM